MCITVNAHHLAFFVGMSPRLLLLCGRGPRAGWRLWPAVYHLSCFCKTSSFCLCVFHTVALLLLDPLYLSLLCGLFGGGDMNGIALLVPELAARLGFGVLLILNALALFKRVLPVYSRSFSEGGAGETK